MRIIFFIMIGLFSISYADFSRENGIVTDSDTNLEWQDNYSDSQTNARDITQATWSEAIDYCEELNLNGYGWRLPNINELKSLVRSKEPAISHIFKHHNFLTYTTFWSSTSNASNSNEAWVVGFMYGKHHYVNKDMIKYVRCVRNKQVDRVWFFQKLFSK